VLSSIGVNANIVIVIFTAIVLCVNGLKSICIFPKHVMIFLINKSVIFCVVYRIQLDRSGIELLLQLTIEEPWASYLCTTSQMKSPSMQCRTGEQFYSGIHRFLSIMH